jgi:S1-C subfamily serine protease
MTRLYMILLLLQSSVSGFLSLKQNKKQLMYPFHVTQMPTFDDNSTSIEPNLQQQSLHDDEQPIESNKAVENNEIDAVVDEDIEEEGECLLLDSNEKAAIIAQRQGPGKSKKENDMGVFRSWMRSFISFFVVITIGSIGSIWEATSPIYPEPISPRSSRIAVLDDPMDDFLSASPDESSYESDFQRQRDRTVLARNNEVKRTSVISYVKDAVQKVSPSVLRIDTETHLKMEGGQKPPPGTWLQEGQGSGVIFSPEGLVLTNAHVVDDTSKLTVTLSDGRVFRAEVIGSDEVTDIAVLRIVTEGEEKENFHVADFGDSDALEVGQFVVALGSPGGLDMTATLGIVSGLRRSPSEVGLTNKKVNFIQTDAALNPGNSGGPLVDVETGSVIGINTCIRSNMEGTSFSIPINKVQDIISDLSEGKTIHHSYIGAVMADCTPTFARQVNANSDSGLKVPELYGALVSRVFPDSPASLGGLQANDIIIDIGGTKVRSSEDASRCIDRALVGKDLIVIAIREGSQVELRMRPIDLSSQLKVNRADRQRQKSRPRKFLEELLPLNNG